MGNISSLTTTVIKMAAGSGAGKAKSLAQTAVEAAAPSAKKVMRRSKYSSPEVRQIPLPKISQEDLAKFSQFGDKAIFDIPIEDCIELQRLLTKTFQTGSREIPSLLKAQYPFLTNNPKEYLKILETLEMRIQNYTGHIKFSPIAETSLTAADKRIVDFANSLNGSSTKEAVLLINKYSSKYGLDVSEQVRLARLVEARRIAAENPKNLEQIAYRLRNTEDMALFSILEPTFYRQNLSQLEKLAKSASIKNISLPAQTSMECIMTHAKTMNMHGYNVRVCDIDDVPKLSGFFHTPESAYGDTLYGNPVSNDIYRRFGNFRYTFCKPTNDMPVCFTYGTGEKPIIWGEHGFFANVPNNSIHAGGTGDLGSGVNTINDCVENYVFGMVSPKNNVGELLAKNKSMDEILAMSGQGHNEYLCSNGSIQAFYTNNLSQMDKSYFELAEKYNIPIINLKGKGIGVN